MSSERSARHAGGVAAQGRLWQPGTSAPLVVLALVACLPTALRAGADVPAALRTPDSAPVQAPAPAAAPALDPPPPSLAEAVALYTGTAGRVDDQAAHARLETAAATGHPLARFWVARCHSRGRMGYAADAARARQLAGAVVAAVAARAEAGELEAVFLMGTAYDEGLGRDEDAAEAARWFRRAAERGHALAQHNLGNAYAAGRGVAVSEAEAVTWWLKAAAVGDAVPQLRLGAAYEAGRGVPQDLAEARRWYAEAARRGHPQAKAALDRLGPGGAR